MTGRRPLWASCRTMCDFRIATSASEQRGTALWHRSTGAIRLFTGYW